MQQNFIEMSDAFIERHHFHVVRVEDNVIVGMFASLFCAARTALDGPEKNVYLNDVLTGETFEGVRIHEMGTRESRDIEIPRDREQLNGGLIHRVTSRLYPRRSVQ